MILIYPEFKLLKHYDKFVRRDLGSIEELACLFCYDIENCLFKNSLFQYRVDIFEKLIVKDYKNV
ncbi:MAG TPA: hypothetical protein PLH46_03010 [Caldisericia bacterium]|nr:hypothetical protein [Caldisericia bacterium]